MNHWLFHTQWLDNSTLAWVVAALGALLGYLLAHAAVAVVASRLEALAKRRPGSTAGIAAAVARATRGWLLLLLAIAVAGRCLNLPPSTHGHLGQLIYLLAGLQLAFWLTRLIVAWLGRTAPDGTPRNSVMFGIVSWTAQLVVWVVVALAVLANAGVNVNAFIASLGVGGVAVALAAQTVLGDLFASVSIGLDKPFEVGESIAFGSDSGTVKRVGIKSTRIQSLSGEELSISNSILLKELVHNYSRMSERRIAFGFRVAIDTPRASVERLVGEVRRLIEGMDKVRFDRGHMTGFGDCSLDFEFVYYVLDPGFAAYRDIQQRINFGLMDLLDGMQVKLAVPVRALHDAGPGRAPSPYAT